MSPFEIIMLLCFGFSWPFAIIKTVKAKNPAGKSFLFLTLLLVGYVSGCMHKIVFKYDNVFWLYVINGMMVMTDLLLSLYYRARNSKL